MISAIRRLRQKLDTILSGWMPPQDVTLLVLRPMPWEIDRAGQAKAGFRRAMAELAAAGWRGQCGHADMPATGAPRLRSFSGRHRLRPFARLTIASQLSALGEERMILSHLVTGPGGVVVASMTSELPMAEPLPAAVPELALNSAIAPARDRTIARAA